MIWTFFGAAFGAVVGHFLTRYIDRLFANAHRTETQRDDLEQQIVSCIDELLEHCEEFWASDAALMPERNTRLMAAIPAKLHHVNSLSVDLLDGHMDLIKLTREEFSAVHQIATGGEFSEPTRKASASVLAAALSDLLNLRRGVVRRRKQLRRPILG